MNIIRTIDIDASAEKLMDDIMDTDNVVKKTILRNLLKIKLMQMSDVQTKQKNVQYETIKKKRENAKKSEVINPELKTILKKKETSLDELEEISRKKAYDELLKENKLENDKKMLRKTRGNNEKNWNSNNIYDPKYAKYLKDDSMNNKLMERLNSEIDFRMDDTKAGIERPFEKMDENDIMETFAKYENPNRKN